jgi:hypothetical protein
MARKQSTAAFNYARGDGWILTNQTNRQKSDHPHHPYEWDVVLYYIGGGDLEDCHVETHEGITDPGRFMGSYLDVGGKRGENVGERAEPNTPVREQPRAVRMKRHAVDIYDELGDVRGMSPTIALRAALTFGSKWGEKDNRAAWKGVDMVGEGRAKRFASALE